LKKNYVLFRMVQFQTRLSEDLIKRLEEYRWNHRIRSRNETIRILLEEALKAHYGTCEECKPKE